MKSNSTLQLVRNRGGRSLLCPAGLGFPGIRTLLLVIGIVAFASQLILAPSVDVSSSAAEPQPKFHSYDFSRLKADARTVLAVLRFLAEP